MKIVSGFNDVVGIVDGTGIERYKTVKSIFNINKLSMGIDVLINVCSTFGINVKNVEIVLVDNGPILLRPFDEQRFVGYIAVAPLVEVDLNAEKEAPS